MARSFRVERLSQVPKLAHAYRFQTEEECSSRGDTRIVVHLFVLGQA